jgi:hypothetical protein
VDATVRLKVDEPEPVIDVGLKVPVTPVGKPLTDKATAESNPSATVEVTVELPLLPWTMETDVADRLKVGDVATGARALMSAAPLGLPQPVTRS